MPAMKSVAVASPTASLLTLPTLVQTKMIRLAAAPRPGSTKPPVRALLVALSSLIALVVLRALVGAGCIQAAADSIKIEIGHANALAMLPTVLSGWSIA